MDRWQIIRRAAVRLRQDYAECGGVPADAAGAASRLDDLAERCFGLTVIDDPDLPESVLGELNLEEETILVHPALSPARRAFVVAHELGHRALEHPPRRIQDLAEHI